MWLNYRIMHWSRHMESILKTALRDTPVVLLVGSRQSGKTTLVQSIGKQGGGVPQYITLDDPATLAAASTSPASFIEDLEAPAIIDEIQRVPELLLALKFRVDQQRKPGLYLLTGSANVLTLPKAADSLAGRMEVQTLWPLSQGEILGRREGFVDACFSKSLPRKIEATNWKTLLERMVCGGYPEVVRRTDASRRRAWWTSYLATLLERDVRDLSNIEGLREMPRLLELLATRTGGLLNYAEISRAAGISTTSVKRYIGLFRALYLHVELPAWFRNLEKRLVKSPKSYLNDTGLLCHLRGIDKDALLKDRQRVGPVLENFVIMEIRKQLGWSQITPRLYHYRDASGNEVDLVMEAPDGRLVGIEIKASIEVGRHDFRGLKELASQCEKDFVRGIVLYAGSARRAFGENLYALPLSSIWSFQQGAK